MDNSRTGMMLALYVPHNADLTFDPLGSNDSCHDNDADLTILVVCIK